MNSIDNITGDNLVTCEECGKIYCSNCNETKECEDEPCNVIISCIKCQDQDRYNTCPRCGKKLCADHIWNHCL